MHYSSNKGLLAKQTAHPPSAASLVHTATKERTENSLLQVTQKIDSADQVARGTLSIGWGMQGVGGCVDVEWDMVQQCSLITVAEKVANRRQEKETQTTMFSGLSCPVLHVK